MPTITILNHGTSNSSGDNLVISRLKSLMHGERGGTWMLNTGVGTLAQAGDRTYLPGWNTLGGIVWAKGLDKNVEESVEFVRKHCNARGANNVRVNMAGHSRGSMTALKIAHRLQQELDTKRCQVNLFLIDPVPGNLGWINAGMYKNIVVEGNVTDAYMFLAESERRNAFKPYVDKTFLQDKPTHRMDTIPGNHGGINELSSKKRHESGDIVLHHAVTFLAERGTAFCGGAMTVVRSDADLLELYSTIMYRFQEYKAQGHKSSGGNSLFHAFGGGVSKGDRKIQEHNPFKNVQGRDKDQYNSQPLKGRFEATQVARESRFFANRDHKQLFQRAFPNAYGRIVPIELGATPALVNAMWGDAAFHSDVGRMGDAGKSQILSWHMRLLGAA